MPDYASLEPQTCELRKRGFANETCNAEFPERRFSREHFSPEYPLLTYDEFCPANCLGQSCDDVEPHLRTKCDCGVCASTSTTSENDDYDFEGGGTRFSSLRDVVFSPEMGGAVVHGARLKHGGEDVIAGDRFVLAFFFDEALCQAAEKGATDVCTRRSWSCLSWCLCWCGSRFFADFGTLRARRCAREPCRGDGVLLSRRPGASAM